MREREVATPLERANPGKKERSGQEEEEEKRGREDLFSK